MDPDPFFLHRGADPDSHQNVRDPQLWECLIEFQGLVGLHVVEQMNGLLPTVFQ